MTGNYSGLRERLDTALSELSAEVEGLDSKRPGLGARRGWAAAPQPDPNFSALFSYLGEAVPPPTDLDPAYSKEGLLGAIQQASQLAGVALKKVEIESSEFPFLAGVVCDSEEDFRKLKAQFKNMPAYEYSSSSGGGGTCVFTITPTKGLPREMYKRIDRRTLLRLQMFAERFRAR